jgi:hypothetical protein
MEALIDNWDLAVSNWCNDISISTLEPLDEVMRNDPLFASSRDIQFLIEDIFAVIIKKSKVKSGKYYLANELIEAHAFKSQSRTYYSGKFNTELIFGINLNDFFIRATISNVECIKVQHDSWWNSLFSLSKYDHFKFFTSNCLEDFGKRNISSFIQKAFLADDEIDFEEFGGFEIRWGSIHELSSSIEEGAMILRQMHTLNQGLYRSQYIRKKRST